MDWQIAAIAVRPADAAPPAAPILRWSLMARIALPREMSVVQPIRKTAKKKSAQVCASLSGVAVETPNATYKG